MHNKKKFPLIIDNLTFTAVRYIIRNTVGIVKKSSTTKNCSRPNERCLQSNILHNNNKNDVFFDRITTSSNMKMRKPRSLNERCFIESRKKNGVQTSNWKKTRPSVSFPVTCFDSFDSDTNPENEQKKKKITEKNAH